MKKLLTFILAFAIFSQQAFAIGASPLRIMMQANPGDTVEGYVDAQNTKKEAMLVNLTKGDFLVDENESLEFMQTPQEGNVHSLMNWIELTENDVLVDALQSKKITYKINIPADAPSGSYYGVVFVQGKSPEAAAQSSGVGISANVAQLILLEVYGDLSRNTELKTFNIIKNDRDEVATNTTFQANVFNSGNTHDSITGTIIVADSKLNKLEELTFNRDKYNTMPERQKTYVENWRFEKYENGTYAAYLDSKNKDEKPYVAEIKFKISTDKETDQKMLTVLNTTIGKSYQDALSAFQNPKATSRVFVVFGLLLLFIIITAITLIVKRKKHKRGKKRFFGLFSILALVFGLSLSSVSAQDTDIITVDATVDVGQYADFALVGCWADTGSDTWIFDPTDDSANLRQPGDRENGAGGDQYTWYDVPGGTPNGNLDPTSTGSFGYDDCQFTTTAQNWSNWNITVYSDDFDDVTTLYEIPDMVGYSTNGFDFTLESEASGYPLDESEHGFFIVNKSAAATDDGTAAGATYSPTKTFDATTCGPSSNRPCYHFIPSIGSPQTIFSSASNVTGETFVVRFGIGSGFAAGTSYSATATFTLNTTP